MVLIAYAVAFSCGRATRLCQHPAGATEHSGVKRSGVKTGWRGTFVSPLKKKTKALRGGDHRLKLQQCAAVMEVITRPCEPHITPTLLHLEPRAGQRKPRAPFKGVRGGSAKGHAERSDTISVSSRASHTSSVWFPEWERVLLKLIAFPGFLAIGTFFL